MLAPLSWIKEYVSTKSSPEKIAEKLLLAGTKVEQIKKVGKELVFELEITPNRPDTLSIVGVARELAAVEHSEFKLPDTDLLLPPKVVSSKVDFRVKDRKLCPYYSLVRLSGVKFDKSPTWMKDYLNLAGVRSINNVVDITNFVMLELGQPMHAFDANKIAGQLTLRGALEGEILITLDGQERKLPRGAIVIEDEKQIIDLAGLMGGQNSEIDAKTKDILLICPIYDPQTIRKTSMSTNLRTEASNRFEKKLDPNMHPFALDRAVKLFFELANARIASKITSTPKVEEKLLTFDKNLIPKVIGISLTDTQINEILSSAGFILRSSKVKEDAFEIQIPSFRTDIQIEEDILEEISRLFGYNNLPKTLPKGDLPQTAEVFEKDSEEFVRRFLLRNGFNEVTGYTLISKEDCQEFGYTLENCLKVKNPASSDFEYLRPTLLINAIKAISANPGYEELGFFEIAKTFEKTIDKTTNLPQQPLKLALIYKGSLAQFKGVVNELWKSLDLNVLESAAEKDKIFSQKLTLSLRGSQFGVLGRLDEQLLELNKIEEKDIFALEVNFEFLKIPEESKYTPVPKYPSIKEDISFFIADKTLVGDIIKQLYRLDKLVYKVELADEFRSSKGRSITLSLEFLDLEKTLQSKEVEQVRRKISKLLESKFKASVRKE